MDSHDAAHAFITRFMQVYDRFHRRAKPTAYRPSRETLAVLEHLAGTGPLTVTEAAHHFSRSQAAMSEIFDRLERREFLARTVDQRDKRRTLVWMTERGEQALQSSRQVLSARLLAHAMDQIAEEDAA